MVKKMKMLFLSCLTIMLCISAIAVGTYALFSQEVKITNHLQAGTLSFKLERTNLVSTVGEGKIDDSTVDFSTTNTQNGNIFGFETGDMIVPTDTIIATMVLTYTGNLDFGYYVYLDMEDSVQSTWGNYLSVSLKDAQGNDLVGGSKDNPIEVEYVQSSEPMKIQFDVVLTFSKDASNDLQAKEAKFDLVVGAVQLTKELPTNP